MNKNSPAKVSRLARISGALPLLAAVAFVVLPRAASAQVEHVVLEVEDALGIPAIQAIIVACTGEEVLFTGTVRITLTDGVATHFNWSDMRAETLDGDVFIAASAANVGQQSNLTLVEIGAGQNNRQFHLQIVAGEVSVTCHV